jgi:hypothetical protein
MKITPINSREDYIKYTNYLDGLYGVELDEDQTNDILVIQQLIDYWEQNNLSKVKLDDDFTNEDLDYIFDLVKNVSSAQGYGLSERVVKLQEEVGELSAEVLKLRGFKKSDLSKDEIRNNILLETVDCLIMSMDILSHEKFQKKEIIEIADKQIEKWLSQL